VKKAIILAALAAIAPNATAQTGAIDVSAARKYFEDLRKLGAADNGTL
jgi:hypothetical protein